MKLCKDCKYYHNKIEEYESEIDYFGHVCVKVIEPSMVSIVTGKITPKHCTYERASRIVALFLHLDSSALGQRCGPEGSFFKVKE